MLTIFKGTELQICTSYPLYRRNSISLVFKMRRNAKIFYFLSTYFIKIDFYVVTPFFLKKTLPHSM